MDINRMHIKVIGLFCFFGLQENDLSFPFFGRGCEMNLKIFKETEPFGGFLQWGYSTPQSSVLIGLSAISHPFWGKPFMDPPSLEVQKLSALQFFSSSAAATSACENDPWRS